LATHILAFEDDAKVRFFEGNFSAYEAKKKEEQGDSTPKRPRFKSLISS
jgi:energy-dependent translational throttle protein EttA